MKIDLVWLGSSESPPAWDRGGVHVAARSPGGVHRAVAQGLEVTDAEAWLFWDSDLGAPDQKTVHEIACRPGDLWHAGLLLGCGGLPRAIDYVVPTWMLNRDPDPHIEASSWRLSLRCCLARTSVLRGMGPPSKAYRTLAGSSLDYGHRCVRRGALCRHVPALTGGRPDAHVAEELPFEDELRFIRSRFGRRWALWALVRAVTAGDLGVIAALRTRRRVAGEMFPPDPPPLKPGEYGTTEGGEPSRVTVLVPTVDRYPYLRTLLDQLGGQTVRPAEVIVVDQTPAERREGGLLDEYPDLPLRVIGQDSTGQCSSRNTGLNAATGEFVLFIDDDDEVGPTLIEDHLRALRRHGCDVSSGVAHEVGAGPLPDEFTLARLSDVFPTNNTMIRIDILQRSGLFDLAYDRSPRADRDLGMRIYLSGALMVLSPDIDVLHHHAPRGGLRAHRARVITYASSRARLLHWHLPDTSEIYLAMRYFSARQVKEALYLRVLGTFRLKGAGRARQAAKGVLAVARLPYSIWQTAQKKAEAHRWLERFPRIPRLISTATAVER